MKLIKHYYGKLNLQYQILYKKLYDAIKRYDEYVLCGVNDCTKEQCLEIIRAIVSDEPELFYVDARKVDIEETNWGLNKIKIKYYFGKEEKEDLAKEIHKFTQLILENESLKHDDPGEVIKNLHDFLIKNVEISTSCFNEISDYTIIGALLARKSSSEGVSLLYKYLLNQLNIDCEILYGKICSDNGEISDLHVWNRVNLYGVLSNIDIMADSLRSFPEEISYDYFAISDEQFYRDHRILKEDLNEYYVQREPIKENIKLDMNTGKNVNEEEQVIFDMEEENMIEEGIKVLEKVLEMSPMRKLHEHCKELLIQLNAVKELLVNYPNKEEEYQQFIGKYLQEVFQLMKEYRRYIKFAENSSITVLVYERATNMISDLSIAIKNKVHLFTSEVAADMLEKIGTVQKKLEKEKAIKRKWPFDLDNLDEQTDIEVYIKAFSFFGGLDFSMDWLQSIRYIHNDLCRMKKAVVDNEGKRERIADFTSYYLPEVVGLIVKYDELKFSGMNDESLKMLHNKISSSLYDISNSLRTELDNIFSYEKIEMQARVDALKEIMIQDGRIESDLKF